MLNCAVLVLGGYAWCLLLRLYAAPVRSADGITVFLLAQFARYLPGNIAHYAGRVALGKRCSIPAAAAAMSLLTELGWTLVAAASVTAACTAASEALLPSVQTLLPLNIVKAFAPAAAAALPIAGAMGMLCWRHLHTHSGLQASSARALMLRLAYCFVIYTSSFLLIGAAADILAMGVLGAKESHLILLTGAFAASWMAGLLAFGAPAGIGVREVVLFELLSPAFGPAVAGGLAIALRAAAIAADGLMFVTACALSRSRNFFPGLADKKSSSNAAGTGRQG
jgi:hypothetical protein